MQGISEQQIATLATRIAARATLFATLDTDVTTPTTKTTSTSLAQATLNTAGAYRLLTHAAASWLTQATANIPSTSSPHGAQRFNTLSLPLEQLVQALREVFATQSQQRAIDQAHERLGQQLPMVLERIGTLHGLPPNADPIAVWLLPLLERRNKRKKKRPGTRHGKQTRRQRAESPVDTTDDALVDTKTAENALVDVVSWLAQAAYADEYSNRPAGPRARATGTHLSEYA